ncbi:MAG: NUDIX hydrolase [bacterium]|nr:NUDIX hydrolase [bacterium]
MKNKLPNLSEQQLQKLLTGYLTYLAKVRKTHDLGSDLFEAIIKIVPQIAVEAIVVDSITNPTRVFLTWREDKNYKGWHFPGGFVRFGEKPENRLKTVINKELNATVQRYKRLDGIYNLIDSRGHTFSLCYLAEISKKPAGGKWFAKKTPKNIIGHHKQILSAELDWY